MSAPLSFTAQDMAQFAAASGDHSPLHTDPEFARCTAFGEPIVYGGLETLAMLGVLGADVLAHVRTVSSSFPGPVLPGEPLSLRVRARPGRPEWEVRLSGRGRLLARLTARGAGSDAEASTPGGSEGEIATAYRVGPERAALIRRFELEALDPAVLEGVLWASHVVGATLPDFDGLCAAVSITAGARSGPAGAQRVAVVDHDERTDRMVIVGRLLDDAGQLRCRGRIECLPFAPTGLPEGLALPATGELVPERGRVVVVGASRGLGAALTLALLSEGFAVDAVYARSAAAAAELHRRAGAYRSRLVCRRADAADPTAMAELAAERDAVDGIALCAAPPALAAGLGGELSRYVARSVDCAAVPLAALVPKVSRGGWILLLSAAAAVVPGAEQPQVGMAKAALEALGRWVASAHPSLRVVVARLPRLASDQVNTPAARAGAAPLSPVAEQLVRALLDAGAAPGWSLVTVEAATAAEVS